MTGLDRIIIKMAIADARHRMREGCLPDQAVIKATPGAWQEYRGDVLCALLQEVAAGTQGEGAAEAARGYGTACWMQEAEPDGLDARRDPTDSV